MADFKGGDIVVVPMPVSPEMVVWALPGPAGDVPYADVEALVDAGFDERIANMTQLELDTEEHASAAAGSADNALGYAEEAEDSAGEAASSASAASTSATEAETHRNQANTYRQNAASYRDDAQAAAGDAEDWATSFDLSVDSTSTGAPGTSASVTVGGNGPAYTLTFQIPQGEKGDQGEVTQEQLDAAVASLVDQAPGTMDTLDELAAALGDDPDFATTVMDAVGEKSSKGHTHTISDVDGLSDSLDSKSDSGHSHSWGAITGKPDEFTPEDHTHPWSQVSGKPDEFPPESHTHSTAQVTGLDSALDGKEPISWVGTQAEYDALGTYDANRTYNIVEG